MEELSYRRGVDGSHWGLADWYPELEEAIQKAVNRGPGYEWTTGWYGSKKEIASANITCAKRELHIEVSISDDFDTPGYGDKLIPHTRDLDVIREAIGDAWEEAAENREDNNVVGLYQILNPSGQWVCTYLVQAQGEPLDFPPGDSYGEWGWQDDADHLEVPEPHRSILQAEMDSGHCDAEHDGWRAHLVGSED